MGSSGMVWNRYNSIIPQIAAAGFLLVASPLRRAASRPYADRTVKQFDQSPAPTAGEWKNITF